MADKKDPSLSPRYTNGPVVKTGPLRVKTVRGITMVLGARSVMTLAKPATRKKNQGALSPQQHVLFKVCRTIAMS
jgi:hypothetical protein